MHAWDACFLLPLLLLCIVTTSRNLSVTQDFATSSSWAKDSPNSIIKYWGYVHAPQHLAAFSSLLMSHFNLLFNTWDQTHFLYVSPQPSTIGILGPWVILSYLCLRMTTMHYTFVLVFMCWAFFSPLDQPLEELHHILLF